MCGRYALHTPIERLRVHFGLQSSPVALEPRYNIAPSQPVAVVREASTGRELVMLRWGLIPFWAKVPKTGYSMINARSETVAEKPAFRAAFRQRRCVIPADGFYEWKRAEHGKQPYHIRRRGGEVLALAGLWERWERSGQMVESCTILVTEANDLMRPIHDRMPVILAPEDYEAWLDGSRFDSRRLQQLLRPYGGNDLEAYPVSKFVNKPGNDDARCLQLSGPNPV
jgi:putative SOS response-associated peptidase YedK